VRVLPSSGLPHNHPDAENRATFTLVLRAEAHCTDPTRALRALLKLVKEAGVPSAAILQREYEALLRARDEHRLAKSVLDVADWLARYNPERLRNRLLERPEWERDALVDYLQKKGRQR
jgi:hypothetical protein